MMAGMRRLPKRVWLSLLWPLLFIALVAGISVRGFQTVQQVQAAGAAPEPDAVKQRLDDIRATLQLLVIAAGLFAATQAGFAFLNAAAFTKQAEDAVKRIETLREDIESRFPNFMETERLERDADQALEEFSKIADWRGRYESLDLPKRQRLLTVDARKAMDLRVKLTESERYGESLRRMAQFYASKYKYNRAMGGGSIGDVERAEYYLSLARNCLGDTYSLLTEVGLLYLEFYDPRDGAERETHYRIAESHFRRSLAAVYSQQRAHYNLGVLASKRAQWAQALAHYEDALRFPNWEDQPRPEMKCNLLYNAACAAARLGDGPKTLTHLREAAALGYVAVRTVRNDYDEPGGDFFELLKAADAGTHAELQDLRDRLSRRAEEEPPVAAHEASIWKRLNRAFHALTGDA